MSGRWRAAALPLLGLVLVGGVLGVQVANGGGDFVPARPADPCVARTVTSRAHGIDALTERLVLLGLDGAACRLGVSREALTLRIAGPGRRTDAEIEALRGGLLAAVARMDLDGSLPKSSSFVDEVLDSSDLNPVLRFAIRALPDALVDAALPTRDVLERAVRRLDLRALLGNVSDRRALEDQVRDAVTQAAKDTLLARLRGLV